MKTYPLFIKGIDESMETGIPKGHIILLSGTPGTYKTSISYNTLLKNAQENGTNGMYISLEQDKKGLEYHLKQLGFTEPTNGHVELFDMANMRIRKEEFQEKKAVHGGLNECVDLKYSVMNLKEMVKNRIEKLNLELIVVDSLELMELAFKMDDPREDLFYFFNWLKGLEITTIMIAEALPDKYSRHDMGFLADGIITVRMDRMDNLSTQRFISIVKMRGVKHTTDYFVLNFTNGAFEATKAIM